MVSYFLGGHKVAGIMLLRIPNKGVQPGQEAKV